MSDLDRLHDAQLIVQEIGVWAKNMPWIKQPQLKNAYQILIWQRDFAYRNIVGIKKILIGLTQADIKNNFVETITYEKINALGLYIGAYVKYFGNMTAQELSENLDDHEEIQKTLFEALSVYATIWLMQDMADEVGDFAKLSWWNRIWQPTPTWETVRKMYIEIKDVVVDHEDGNLLDIETRLDGSLAKSQNLKSFWIHMALLSLKKYLRLATLKLNEQGTSEDIEQLDNDACYMISTFKELESGAYIYSVLAQLYFTDTLREKYLK